MCSCMLQLYFNVVLAESLKTQSFLVGGSSLSQVTKVPLPGAQRAQHALLGLAAVATDWETQQPLPLPLLARRAKGWDLAEASGRHCWSACPSRHQAKLSICTAGLPAAVPLTPIFLPACPPAVALQLDAPRRHQPLSAPRATASCAAGAAAGTAAAAAAAAARCTGAVSAASASAGSRSGRWQRQRTRGGWGSHPGSRGGARGAAAACARRAAGAGGSCCRRRPWVGVAPLSLFCLLFVLFLSKKTVSWLMVGFPGCYLRGLHPRRPSLPACAGKPAAPGSWPPPPSPEGPAWPATSRSTPDITHLGARVGRLYGAVGPAPPNLLPLAGDAGAAPSAGQPPPCASPCEPWSRQGGGGNAPQAHAASRRRCMPAPARALRQSAILCLRRWPPPELPAYECRLARCASQAGILASSGTGARRSQAQPLLTMPAGEQKSESCGFAPAREAGAPAGRAEE